MSHLSHLAAAAIAGVVLLHAGAAAAQQNADKVEGGILGWNVSASLQLRVSPDFMGSKSYHLGPGGSVRLSRVGVEPQFAPPDDSPSLHLVGDKVLSAGLVARYRSGRDDDGVLRGFDKIKWSVEPGAYVNWWPIDGLRVRGELRHGFGGDRSWLADLSADAVHEDPTWVLSIGPRVHLAESKFTQTYFGVTPLDAARSPFGIAPFAGNGAFASAGALASAEYRWTRRWSLLADADYRRLMGTAADSPIVTRLGSKDQFAAAVGVRYAFGR